VLLTFCVGRENRQSADGRVPIDNGIHAFDVAVHQVHASTAPPRSQNSASRKTTSTLSGDDLTILTAWAEAVAKAMRYAPARAQALLAEAHGHAAWRATLGLPEPSTRLDEAFDLLEQAVRTATPPASAPTAELLLTAASESPPRERELDRLVRRVLLATLEERLIRQPAHSPPAPLASTGT
jgi:hypothetical protein